MTPGGLGLGISKQEVRALFPFAKDVVSGGIKSGFGWFVPIEKIKNDAKGPTKLIYELYVDVKFSDNGVSGFSLALFAEPWD